MNSEPDRPENDEAEANAAVVEASETETTAEPEDEALAALQAKSDEHWDKYLRAAAELENVRKRAARDVENAHKFAIERFATDLLSVCDSLEMALATDDVSVDSLKEGSEATMKQLAAVLQRFGVQELNPEGEPFDPAQHEAMTMQPSDEQEPGSVLTVFQKGYALNGRLLRPARVVVAAEPPESAEKG